MNDRTKSFLRLLLFMVVLASVAITVNKTGLGKSFQPEILRNWVQGFGILGPLIYILVFAIAPALFLPGLPVTVTGGLVFGPLWGTVYASIGSTLGAALAFLISRYFARQQVKKLLGEKLLTFDRGVEQKGWIFVAITRLIPVFPYNLINYAFGLTRIKFHEYLITSWICMLPATTAYVIFSSSLLDILRGKLPKELIVGVILLVLISLVPVFYYRKMENNKKRNKYV